MNSSLPTENAYKTNLLIKYKIKDNGLQRCICSLDKLEEEDHAERLKLITSIIPLINSLKKAKEVAAAPPAIKYLNDLLGSVQHEHKEVSKAKLLAEKADILGAKAEALQAKADAMQAKADADAARREEEAGQEDEENEEDESGAGPDMLKKALQSLKTSKVPFYFIACDAKPQYAVIISKRPIATSAKHKAELTKMAGGSKKYLKPGTCRMDNGKLVFEMEKPPAGLAAKLQKAVKSLTGLPLKVMVGKESADDEEQPSTPEESDEVPKFVPGVIDEPERGKVPKFVPGVLDEPEKAEKDKPPLEDATRPFEISASVGRGGKNKQEDVEAVQIALNKLTKAGLQVDGKCGPKTIAAITAFQKANLGFADGLVEPGKKTATALAGGKVTPAVDPKKGSGGGGTSKAEAGGGTKKTEAGGALGGILAGAMEAIKKAAQEIAERKARADQIQEAMNRFREARKKLGKQADYGLGKLHSDRLIKALKQQIELIEKIAAAKRELEKRKNDAAQEVLIKVIETTAPIARAVEDTLKQAVDWLRENAPNVGENPNDLAKRVGKEIADRKKQAEQAFNDAIQKLKRAAADQTGAEGKTIKQELEKAYNEARQHISNVEKAIKNLTQRKTAEAGDALKKAAEQTIPGFKAVEDQAEKAVQWAQQQGSSVFGGAKDLAKQVTKAVADQKKKAEKFYHDIVNKLKKEADDQLGDEGKQIKKELEDAYKQAQEHAKNVAKAAADLAKRKTEEAAKALQKAAEDSVPGFKAVEDLAKKASDWWDSD